MVTGIRAQNAGSEAGYTPQMLSRSEPTQNQFMQLLINQIRYQDPLSPMKDGEFLSQMTQLSTLEQLAALNTRLTCISLVGKRVAVAGEDGQVTTGVVEGVTLFGYPMLKVDGKDVPLEAVIEVVNQEADDQHGSEG